MNCQDCRDTGLVWTAPDADDPCGCPAGDAFTLTLAGRRRAWYKGQQQAALAVPAWCPCCGQDGEVWAERDGSGATWAPRPGDHDTCPVTDQQAQALMDRWAEGRRNYARSGW